MFFGETLNHFKRTKRPKDSSRFIGSYIGAIRFREYPFDARCIVPFEGDEEVGQFVMDSVAGLATEPSDDEWISLAAVLVPHTFAASGYRRSPPQHGAGTRSALLTKTPVSSFFQPADILIQCPCCFCGRCLSDTVGAVRMKRASPFPFLRLLFWSLYRSTSGHS